MKTTVLNVIFAVLALVALPASGAEVERPKGAPENAWRYQLYNGRWWYWTPHDQWSYYDGRRWLMLSARGGTSERAGSARQQGAHQQGPAAVGRLPVRTYSNFGGSGFYGPSGQGSPGQPPAILGSPGVPGSSPRSAAGASELGISGSRSGDANSGVGGGAVGGTSVTRGLAEPTRP